MSRRRQQRTLVEAMERRWFRCIDCEWDEDGLDGYADPEAAARYHARSRCHYVTFTFEGQGAFNYRAAASSREQKP
jgi:hypothetical protein